MATELSKYAIKFSKNLPIIRFILYLKLINQMNVKRIGIYSEEGKFVFLLTNKYHTINADGDYLACNMSLWEILSSTHRNIYTATHGERDMDNSFSALHIKRIMLFLGLFILLTLGSGILVAQNELCTSICYVDANSGSPSNGGTSPSDAFATILTAIDTVESGGEIIVAAGTYNEAINIFNAVTITGAGAAVTIIDGINNLEPTLDISEDIDVVIQGVTIRNSPNNVDGVSIFAGQVTINDAIISANGEDGIFVSSGAVVTINNSTIANNFMTGINNRGVLTVNNSTISGHNFDGLANTNQAEVILNHVTIANNGIGIDNGNVAINNSLVVNNEDADCSENTNLSSIVGDNLQTDGTCGAIPQTTSSNLALETLANNGGTTPTHALDANSVAIDAVETCSFIGGGAVAVDQRGISRPQYDACDIGAFEADAFPTITITKSVISGDTSQSFDFSGAFDFNLGNGDSETFIVSNGTYEFIELVPDGWTLNNVTSCGVLEDGEIIPVIDGSITTLTGDNDEVTGISVTIDSVVDVVCTFQNEQDIASLTVTKIVNWGTAPVNPAETFEICISGPSYPQPDCDTVGAQGGDLEWDNLIPGIYTVTETNPGNEWSVSSLFQEVEVTTDGENTATITNTNVTSQTGSLAVTKIVEWGNNPVNEAVIFEICITGPSYPQGDCLFYGATTSTQTWTDLQPGPYTVDEVNPVANWIVDEPDPNTAFFVNAGQTTEAYVTNTYNPQRTGSITANVNVDWNGNPVDNAQTFIVCLAGTVECRIVSATGGSAVFQNVPVGDYVVIEQNPGTQWTVSGGGPVTVTADGNATTSFNNVHDPVVIVCDAETDLSGWIDIGTTTATGYVTNNNSITCEYQIGMASYQMFDDIIDNQIIVDSVNTAITLASGEQTSLTVNLPACAVQVDLFYGETLQSLDGARYGDRLLSAIQYTTPEYCVP